MADLTGLHPLGYRKRYLLRAFGYAVRLHVWHGSREDPHDHRWSFIAIPLRGTFLERRWAARTTGTDWIRHECRSAVCGIRPPLMRVGTNGLALRMQRLRRPLRPYRCALGEIHSYEPVGGGPHVSLVFLGRVRREASNVWRRGGPEPDG